MQVLAKTAYFSSNKLRMETPDPVDVDISAALAPTHKPPNPRNCITNKVTVLDPYLFNIIPESLLRIIGLIMLVVPFSWWLGGWIHRDLLAAVREVEGRTKKEL